jgi:putative membrane protein
MMLHWLLSAVALYAVSRVISGFQIANFGWALIAVIVIGLINATLGIFLKIVTFPLTVFTLGIFWFVINALMLLLAAKITPGFRITGFVPAFWAAIVLSLINMLIRWATRKPRREPEVR